MAYWGIILGFIIPVVLFGLFVWMLVVIQALKWLSLKHEIKQEIHKRR
jgi:hypothetical protein